MYINDLKSIFQIIDYLYNYLKEKNVQFNTDGFPIFEKNMFLDEWPDLVIPYSQRKNKRVVNKKKTVICFFDKDQKLYPRVSKVLNEIEEYKKYMGVIGMDITITTDMDKEMQRALLLLNQLFLMALAINGIKIVFNTRSAGLFTTTLFNNIPHNVMVASGLLGCKRSQFRYDFDYIQKIITLLPDKLIIYGKHDAIIEEQLNTLGLNYKFYCDFHRLCKEV